MPVASTLAPSPIRQIVHRSRGRSHGFVTRLMSPGDLGRILKPFVFLDLVDNKGEVFPAFGLHPHSGLATLTYIAEGSVSYEDTNGATGILGLGTVGPSVASWPPSIGCCKKRVSLHARSIRTKKRRMAACGSSARESTMRFKSLSSA